MAANCILLVVYYLLVEIKIVLLATLSAVSALILDDHVTFFHEDHAQVWFRIVHNISDVNNIYNFIL